MPSYRSFIALPYILKSIIDLQLMFVYFVESQDSFFFSIDIKLTQHHLLNYPGAFVEIQMATYMGVHFRTCYSILLSYLPLFTPTSHLKYCRFTVSLASVM